MCYLIFLVKGFTYHHKDLAKQMLDAICLLFQYH